MYIPSNYPPNIDYLDTGINDFNEPQEEDDYLIHAKENEICKVCRWIKKQCKCSPLGYAITETFRVMGLN